MCRSARGTPLRAALVVALAVACGGPTQSVTPRAGQTAGEPSPSSTPVAPTATASVPPRPAPTSERPAPPGSAPASPSASPDAPPKRDPDQRYEVSLMVLESRQHGPQLCAGGIAMSLPPQCGGPDVRPWSWAEVEGEESQSGTTWGVFRLVGTFDGRVFHLTEQPRPPRRDRAVDDTPPFEPGCPEPAGGWRVVDRDRVSAADQEAAVRYANAQPDVAAVWLSWLGDAPPSEDRPASDAVLNLAFTGDLDRHRSEARALWGGALCVTSRPRSRAALERKQRALDDAREQAEAAGVYFYGSSLDEVDNVVRATVLIDDAAARYWVERRFGAGWVELAGVFRPVR